MKRILLATSLMTTLIISCKKDTAVTGQTGNDPDKAEKVSVDRFSATAGHLFVRTETNGLPAANAPIDFDAVPGLITTGFTPDGHTTSYYNFDVQPAAPDDIYAFYKSDGITPVSGQLNVINSLPGEAGYNDFWIVNKVIVPDDYTANTLTSEDEILKSGYTVQKTNTIVNCPVVPEGSVAAKRFGGGSNALVRGWIKGKIVFYFKFEEKALTATESGQVPLSDIYVSFNKNPDDTDPESGPASGFKTEEGTSQTHNVISTVPADAGYSPFWDVLIYDNADFDAVNNLSTAESATSLGAGGLVNCPVFSIE